MGLLEYIYYESLPFVYAALSLFAIYNMETNKIVGLAGIVLAFCSYQVFNKRYMYRTFAKGKVYRGPRI